MNETHEFSKHYNVCINEIISFPLRLVFGHVKWIFASVLERKIADQITEG